MGHKGRKFCSPYEVSGFEGVPEAPPFLAENDMENRGGEHRVYKLVGNNDNLLTNVQSGRLPDL